jgi:predicted solute-binding protein
VDNNTAANRERGKVMDNEEKQTAKFDQQVLIGDKELRHKYVDEKVALLVLIKACKVIIGANEVYELTETEWQKFYAAVLAAEALVNG